MDSKYFDDWKVGDEFITVGRTVTEADVMNFAGITGDNHILHTDEEYASKNIFKTRIAHGLLGMCIAMGLFSRSNIILMSARANLAVDNWKFKAPIYFGDTIHLRVTVAAMRNTSKGDAGIMTFRFEIINQKGQVVQEGDSTQMVAVKGK